MMTISNGYAAALLDTGVLVISDKTAQGGEFKIHSPNPLPRPVVKYLMWAFNGRDYDDRDGNLYIEIVGLRARKLLEACEGYQQVKDTPIPIRG